MTPFDADVIIVGAGPAGSIAAFELASFGVDVLVLEKSAFPRYKTCGGGLTFKTLQEIPFDIHQVVERRIHSILFSKNFKDLYIRRSPDPLICCTMRSNLDEFLLNKAIEKGAKFRMNQHVVRIEESGTGVTVTTKNSSFHAQLVIGAEGVAGIVSRSMHLRKNIVFGLAWEAEIKVTPFLHEQLLDTVFLDWGTIPGGYGWLFPKKDHISVGVGGPSGLSHLMMPYYQRFLDHIRDTFNTGLYHSGDRSAETTFDVISLQSWPIPVRTEYGSYHSLRTLVTGDAAGFSDPLTGEGIYYAIRSGRLSAGTCFEFLSGKISSLSIYNQRVNDELMKELLEAKKIKDLFNVFPGRIHRFIRESDRGWRAFSKILRGERWYIDVRNGFGRWRGLWNMVCKISSLISFLQESRWVVSQKKTRLFQDGSSAKVRKRQSSV